MTSVEIRGLEPVARLAGEVGSEVASQGGEMLLRGDFRLEILGTRSDPLRFDIQGRVVAVEAAGSGWSLRRTARLAFFFPQPLRVQTLAEGPWLQAGRASLTQDAGGKPLLSLDDSTMSLVGGQAFEGTERLHFPTSAGPRSQPLWRLEYPSRAELGYFVRPFEGGYAVFAGGVTDRAFLDHARVARCVVQTDCALVFRLCNGQGAPAPRVTLDASASAQGVLVDVATVSRVQLRRTPSPAARTSLRLTRLDAEDGWLTASGFADAEVAIRRAHATASAEAGDTFLSAPAARMRFHLELPTDGGAGGALPAAQFVYEDPSLAAPAGAPPSHRDRFYGLRVRGLGSTRGSQAVLDADLLTVDLQKGPAGPSFEIRAGGRLRVRGQERDSVLAPKSDLRSPARERVLEVPAGVLNLRCQAEAQPVGFPSPLRFDTETEELVVVDPVLAGPPLGASAVDPAIGPAVTAVGFSQWELALPAAEELRLAATDGGILPAGGADWLQPFRSVPRSFRLLAHPGAVLSIDRGGPDLALTPRAALAEAAGTGVTTLTTVHQAEGKELAVYSALFAVASYLAIDWILTGRDVFLPDNGIKLHFRDLADDQAREFVKRNGLNDLQIAYLGAADAARIEDFIERNRPQTELDTFHWPFAMGLSIPLWIRDGSPRGRYLTDLCRDRGLTPALGFDLSSLHSVDFADLGWTAAEMRRAVDKSPLLWPRGSDRSGARLDPSDPHWNGIFFRNMPLVSLLQPSARTEIENRFPVLLKFYDEVNANLVLEYGWKDESGSTWYGGFEKPEGVDFTPEAWADDLDLRLMKVVTQGAAGQVVAGEAEMLCTLKRITHRQTGEPLRIRGSFVVNLAGGLVLDRIELVPENAEALETSSIPGFQQVRLVRLVTDLKSARFDLEMVPDAELVTALPFLGGNEPLAASLFLDFTGAPRVEISLTLPAERATNLFGKWPFTVRGLTLRLGGGAELRVRGRLDLGLAGFASIGVDVVVRGMEGNWSLGVEIEEVSGSLSLGSARLEGSLRWSRELEDLPSSLARADLASQGRNRDLWGIVRLTGVDVLGDTTLGLRIGTRGEMSYWVGVAQLGATIPIGSARLEKPTLLLARHADFDGRLQEALRDVTTSLVGRIRPEGNLGDWMRRWQPSEDIGLLVAGSGYLHLHDLVAASAEGKETDPNNPEYQTSVVFTDSGLIRIDSWVLLLASKVIRIGLAIDPVAKILTAGLQVPQINFPEQNPQYQIHPGYMVLGLGWGPNTFFKLSIGWPELVPGSDLERDWSKSTKVYIKGMVPINTFWGGYRAEVQGGQVRFGYAVRAGWTWSTEANGAGIARARAEVGIALGGVFEFVVTLDRRGDLLAPLAVNPELSATLEAGRALATTGLPAGIRASMALAEASLVDLNSIDIDIVATLYADVWGKGSAELLGVTIASIDISARARFQVCGSLHRGITRAWARVGFNVRVRIGCVTFSARAEFDIYLKRGDCPALSLAPLLLPPDALTPPALLLAKGGRHAR